MIEGMIRHRGWFIFLGCALILAGMFGLLFPLASSLAVELITGIAFIAAGIAQIVQAFGVRNWGGFLLQLLGGLLFALAGILLLAYPIPGLLALTLFIGVIFAVEGIFRIILAFRLRPMEGWGWVLFGGICALIIAGLIAAHYPISAAWALGALMSANLIVSGFTFLMLAQAAQD